ncbi:Hsp33 family molecular chaperone HslO [Peredibacter sp. HCB2-198]|uniref:Hsp33 family molecular chaperone HslO n=1 Tax=Peredibacter sp. HCB2-198 TaxID=3383025 RepID=UPI0038B5EF91
MLAVSRLYSFLDHKNGFNVHFLEGQKLIHDLVLMHPMQGSGFAYFRDTFLGLLPIIFFLKPGESLGLYIDSEDPYFRLKIETNSAGHTRTLLLPEEFNLFPMKISGQARVTKIFPGNKTPYTSVIELNDTETKDVINQILSESYQTNSEVIVGEMSDQSIMVTKLPPVNVNSTIDESISRKDYIKKHKNFFHNVFEMASNDIEKIVKLFEDHGFSYMGSRQIDFFCPCSKDRMVLNLRGLYAGDLEELFEKDDSVEIKCDYCRKSYHINKSEILNN